MKINYLPDAEALYANLLEFLRLEFLKSPNIQIAGLASGGAWIAKRLAGDLGLLSYGVINVSFHRDDYEKKGASIFNALEGMSTHLPFEVEAARIILVDDVLDTGRSVRAALNELFDYGRPAKVDLAVLVDRDRRELPICATFTGITERLAMGSNLVLNCLPDGKFVFELTLLE
jgi:pyrimidine operon attenuation protein/uracil phosphoribosyltransferase